MSRPRNAKPEATRGRVLASARKLFAENGEGRTSIREIAKGAKVTGATVLHYFGSKDGLYDACVADMYRELGALQETLLPAFLGQESPQAAAEAAIRATFRFARQHQLAIRLLFRNVSETGEIGAGREAALVPFLESAQQIFARPGRTATETRLVLQSLVFLVGRYAVASIRELAIITGVPAETSLHAVEDHLASVAVRELFS